MRIIENFLRILSDSALEEFCYELFKWFDEMLNWTNLVYKIV